MKRAISIWLVFVLVASSAVVLVGVGDEGVEGKEVVKDGVTYTAHAPIRINSNAELSAYGLPGNGSSSNPWLINSYEIDASGKSYCIYIGNTTDYFTILNCLLYNATTVTSLYNGGAITFNNVANGMVMGCNVSWNKYAGMRLIGCVNCHIEQNDAWNMTGPGISISDSTQCNITNNVVGGNSLSGIYVVDSTFCDISNNDAIYNNKAFNGLDAGIVIRRYGTISCNNLIHDNYIAYNTYVGLYVLGENDSFIYNNTITHQSQYGFRLMEGKQVSIGFNIISYNNRGLLITENGHNTIYMNLFHHNWGALNFDNNGDYNLIMHNNFSFTSSVAITIDQSFSNVIHNNSFYSNNGSSVIRIESGLNNRIYNNDIIGYTTAAYDYYGTGIWNLAYPGGGNFWSKYAGTDTLHGEYPQNISGADGMGDSRYSMGGVLSASYDYYPLMKPINSPDDIPPNSKVIQGQYYQSNLTSNVTATAMDLYGIANVTLWYRFSEDNTTWCNWTKYGLDEAMPWDWAFSFSSDDGWYQFYSIANDTSGNTEAPKTVLDMSCIYDTTAPSSEIILEAPYWRNTAQVLLKASASDNLSGIRKVKYLCQFSTDNISWGNSTVVGEIFSDSQWNLNYSWPLEGYYRFSVVAMDCSSIWSNESEYIYYALDETPGTSSINDLPYYWYKTFPIALSAQATDALSGIASVNFYYNFSVNNATWLNSPSLISNDEGPPYSVMFDWPSGEGYYRFFSVAVDTACNIEPDPTIAYRYGCYDSTVPLIELTCPANNSAIIPGTLLDFSVSDTYLNIVNYSINGGSIIPFSAPFDISTGGWTDGTNSVTISANDAVGNAIVRVYSFIIYSTAPLVDAGTDTIRNSEFLQNATASDIPSGIATYQWSKISGPGLITFGTPNAEDTTISADADGVYIIQLNVTNIAGNWAVDNFTLVWDTIGPTTTISIETPVFYRNLNNNTVVYVNASTQFNISAIDDGSGVNETRYRIWSPEHCCIGEGDNVLWVIVPGGWTYWTQYSGNFSLGGIYDDMHYIEYFSIDNLGFNETIKNVTVVLDKFGPVTSISPLGWAEYPTIVNSNTLINISADDQFSLSSSPGVGVGSIQYRIWNVAGWTSWMQYSGDFNLNVEGINHIEYYSVDYFGHSDEIQNSTYNLDSTAPTIISITPANNSVNVELNTTIIIRFSEPINYPFYSPIWFWSSDDSNVTYSTKRIENNTAILVTILGDLAANTTYNLTILSIVWDYADNYLDKNYTFYFTTMASTENNTSSEIDSDNDGTPDTADPDDDNDGFLDEWETFLDTDPLEATDMPVDTDGDGTPDGDSTNSQPWMDTDDDGDDIPDDGEVPSPVEGPNFLADYWWIILLITIIAVIGLMVALRGKPEPVIEETPRKPEPEPPQQG